MKVSINENEPECRIEYYPDGPAYYSGAVTAHLTKCSVPVNVNSPVSGMDTQTLLENGEVVFRFADVQGAEREKKGKVDRIKTGSVAAIVDAYPNTWTNSCVQVTLTGANIPLEEIEVTKYEGPTPCSGDMNFSTQEHTIAKTQWVSENGEVRFEFKDTQGNTGVAEGVIDQIDKTPPQAEAILNTTAPTRDSVKVTLVVDKVIQKPDGREGDDIGYVFTKVYTENVDEEVVVTDLAGNVETAAVVVANISDTAPSCEISYNHAGPSYYSGDVIATLTGCSVPVTVISPSDGALTQTLIKNGSVEFIFVDGAGNTGSIVGEVNWINRDYPICLISLDRPKKD